MERKFQSGGASPRYLQIYQQLRDDIVRAVYPYHGKLPSKRVLADQLGVSSITVTHAYALLCDEGYVEARERSGFFVIFRADDGFAGTAEGETARRMGSPATPDRRHSQTQTQSKKEIQPQSQIQAQSQAQAEIETSFPVAQMIRIVRRVMSDRWEAAFERSPNAGRRELREAISRYLARSRGIRAEAEQIVIGSGSEYLYGLAVELLGRGRTYAIESPSYQKIELVYRAADVRIEMLPLGRDGIESGALADSKADVLHISPYRSFPSGVTATASKRHEYLRWAGAERYLIEDDFESEFSVSRKPEDTLFSLADTENVIYLNTFSKTVSPSLRVGYMVLPKHLMRAFQKKLGFYACTVPTFVQLVLAELIEKGDFERHINRVRRAKRRAMQTPAR